MQAAKAKKHGNCANDLCLCGQRLAPEKLEYSAFRLPLQNYYSSNGLELMIKKIWPGQMQVKEIVALRLL